MRRVRQRASKILGTALGIYTLLYLYVHTREGGRETLSVFLLVWRDQDKVSRPFVTNVSRGRSAQLPPLSIHRYKYLLVCLSSKKKRVN